MAGDELGFAIDLFKALPPEEVNRAISPTSLRFAFAQIYEGARTTTEAEIQQVLHFSLDKPRLHNAFNALDLTLEARDLPPSGEVEGDDSVTLDLYNQMFGRPDIQWNQAFIDVLAESYGAPVHLLDFAGDPEGSRVQINDWVFAVTREKIVDLLPAQSIFPEVTAVLVNALYLKAPWDAPFDYVNEQGTFNRKDGSAAVAAMMSGMFETTRHFAAPGVQAVELALRGQELKLVLIVPDTGMFDAFTAGLDGAGLQAIFIGLEYKSLEVTMPRFTFSSTFALKGPLQALGMVTAFELGGADFSGLGGDMAISNVYHQVFIGVDERGVEAAAASAIVTFDSGSPEFETFVVDRPFYFAIRDNDADATLFFGRVLDPSA